MADSLIVGDGLWVVLEPLLSERRPQQIGRPRVDDRVAFTAIHFVLLPAYRGFGGRRRHVARGCDGRHPGSAVAVDGRWRRVSLGRP